MPKLKDVNKPRKRRPPDPPEDEWLDDDEPEIDELLAKRISFLVIAGATLEELPEILGLEPEDLEEYAVSIKYAETMFVADCVRKLATEISLGDIDSAKFALRCIGGWDDANEPKSKNKKEGKKLPPIVRQHIREISGEDQKKD